MLFSFCEQSSQDARALKTTAWSINWLQLSIFPLTKLKILTSLSKDSYKSLVYPTRIRWTRHGPDPWLDTDFLCLFYPNSCMRIVSYRFVWSSTSMLHDLQEINYCLHSLTCRLMQTTGDSLWWSLTYLYQTSLLKGPRTLQLKLQKKSLASIHTKLFSQLQRFFQQFYILAMIFTTIFLEKSLWKSLKFARALKVLPARCQV